MNNEELISRRRFFKKAAKGMLPMLGAIVAGPTVIMNTLTSCSKDSDEDNGNDTPSYNPSIHGDGSLSNPFTPSGAEIYALTLMSIGETSARSFYIKGKVSSISGNYCGGSNSTGRALFEITDEDKYEDILLVWPFYFGDWPYTSGPLLSVGDIVILANIKLKRENDYYVSTEDGYLYSLNGQTSAGSSTCSGCASTCSSTCAGSSSSSSCSDCSNSCSYGCTGDCSSGCSGGCYTGCYSGCKGSCDYTCKEGCYHACTGTCSGMCGNGCGFGSR